MGVISNPKMAFIFPISCILALIFPILIKYFPKCVGKGSFPKSQIKSLYRYRHINLMRSDHDYKCSKIPCCCVMKYKSSKSPFAMWDNSV